MQQVVLPRKFRTTSNCIPTLPGLKREISSTKLTNGNGSVTKTTTTNGASSPADENGESITNGTTNQTSSPGLLLTRQALHTYQSNNHLVHYKFAAYGGSFNELPK